MQNCRPSDKSKTIFLISVLSIMNIIWFWTSSETDACKYSLREAFLTLIRLGFLRVFFFYGDRLTLAFFIFQEEPKFDKTLSILLIVCNNSLKNMIKRARSLKVQYANWKTALINDCLRLSKVSSQFRIPAIYNFSVVYPRNF